MLQPGSHLLTKQQRHPTTTLQRGLVLSSRRQQILPQLLDPPGGKGSDRPNTPHHWKTSLVRGTPYGVGQQPVYCLPNWGRNTRDAQERELGLHPFPLPGKHLANGPSRRELRRAIGTRICWDTRKRASRGHRIRICGRLPHTCCHQTRLLSGHLRLHGSHGTARSYLPTCENVPASSSTEVLRVSLRYPQNPYPPGPSQQGVQMPSQHPVPPSPQTQQQTIPDEFGHHHWRPAIGGRSNVPEPFTKTYTG